MCVLIAVTRSSWETDVAGSTLEDQLLGIISRRSRCSTGTEMAARLHSAFGELATNICEQSSKLFGMRSVEGFQRSSRCCCQVSGNYVSTILFALLQGEKLSYCRGISKLWTLNYMQRWVMNPPTTALLASAGTQTAGKMGVNPHRSSPHWSNL
jgi:hypothetical protein